MEFPLSSDVTEREECLVLERRWISWDFVDA